MASIITIAIDRMYREEITQSPVGIGGSNGQTLDA